MPSAERQGDSKEQERLEGEGYLTVSLVLLSKKSDIHEVSTLKIPKLTLEVPLRPENAVYG